MKVYDPESTLLLQQNGQIALYERRLRWVLVNAQGKPLRVFPKGTTWQRRVAAMGPHDLCKEMWVLIPINIMEDH